MGTQKFTRANDQVFICATAQNSDLDQTGFEALTWVQVKSVINAGNWSTTSNIIGQDTLDEEVTSKQKGNKDGGSPNLEVAFSADDPGQVAVRAASLTVDNYAFKMIRQSGAVIYNRGVVSEPDLGDGGREAFDNNTFAMGFNQKLITDLTGA